MEQTPNQSGQPETRVNSIGAITLYIEDLPAAREFYQAVFSLPLLLEDPDPAVFKFGDTLINLLKMTAAPELIEPAKAAGREGSSRSVFTLEETWPNGIE